MSELTVPYLPEHAAADNPVGSKEGYHPTDEDKKKIRLVDALYGKGKKYRKRYDQNWIDYYKMFRGNQWKEVRPSYRHSEVINLVFQTIQSMVPVMTDSRPKLDFLPQRQDQHELADILSKVAENDWDQNNWLSTLTEQLFDSHFYGASIGYIGHDPDANMGLGNICYETLDPFYFYPDPNGRDINEKRCRWVLTAEPTDMTVLKKEYPDLAKYISADVIDFAQGDKADIYQIMFKSPVDSKLIVEGPSGYDSLAKNQSLKLTLHIKDDEIEELEKAELNEDGSIRTNEEGKPQIKYVQKLKYPKGRKIVCAGGVLLEDSENQFEDGLFPYAKLLNYCLPREFWGVGDVEPIAGPQKTLNKLVSFTLDVMTLMGNPIWVVDAVKSGIDTDNLFNKPGLVVETDDMEAVRREEGVNLQPFILQMIDRYKDFIGGISGSTDISRGVEPTDVTAASAIAELQNAQQTRLRLKSRNVDTFLQQFGKLYLSRVFQFYSVPRIVRVSGNENANEYFYFHVETLDRDQAGEPYLDESGNPTTKRFANIMTSEGMAKQIEIMGDFDVKVSTGSSLPFSKEAKSNLSMNLFKLGVIDDEELLKNVDYPNYQAVIQRMNEKKAMAAQQQAEQKSAEMAQQSQHAMDQAQAKGSMSMAQQQQAQQAQAAAPVA